MAKFVLKALWYSSRLSGLWWFWRRETRFWRRISHEMSLADWLVGLRFALAFVTLLLSAELVRQKMIFWAVFGTFTAGFLFPCHVIRWAVDDSAICLLLYKIVLIASLFTRLCCNAA